jgi:hypothetical protein
MVTLVGPGRRPRRLEGADGEAQLPLAQLGRQGLGLGPRQAAQSLLGLAQGLGSADQLAGTPVPEDGRPVRPVPVVQVTEQVPYGGVRQGDRLSGASRYFTHRLPPSLFDPRWAELIDFAKAAGKNGSDRPPPEQLLKIIDSFETPACPTKKPAGKEGK